jgi:hypothetical protein
MAVLGSRIASARSLLCFSIQVTSVMCNFASIFPSNQSGRIRCLLLCIIYLTCCLRSSCVSVYDQFGC